MIFHRGGGNLPYFGIFKINASDNKAQGNG